MHRDGTVKVPLDRKVTLRGHTDVRFIQLHDAARVHAWQRHRADGPVPVIKGIVKPLQARKMRIALGFRESKSVNGDSNCILFGRSEHRQAHPVDPGPAGTKSTVNNVMTGNS
jgi:hypothetical protein